MQPAETQSAIRALHAAYERLTGQRLALDFLRERNWYDWLQRGLTINGLTLLINEKKSLVRQGKISSRSIKFRYLIADVDQAEEDIAEITARLRNPELPLTDRQSVLKATGRPTAPPSRPARSAADILAADAAFKAFQSLKKSL